MRRRESALLTGPGQGDAPGYAPPIDPRQRRAHLRRLVEQEPRSTPGLCAALLAVDRRAWWGIEAGPAGRSSCTFVRGLDGVWVAYPLLGSASDAEQVAAVIDRSVAVAVDGAAEDVEPLVDHLERSGGLHRFRNVVVPPQQTSPPPADPRTRWATRLDLPALESLFGHYEIAMGRSPRARRAVLDDAIRRMSVIVIDGPGRLDAAIVSEGFTPSYHVWSHGRVHPDARGRGLSWALISRVSSVFAANGLGAMSTVSDDNPMTIPEEFGRIEELCALDLSLPNRFPGEGWARRQVWRAARRVERIGRPDAKDPAAP